MKIISDKLKCPVCGNDPIIQIDKSHIRLDSEYEEETDRTACKTHDNVVIKLKCSEPKCGHTYRAMITFEVNPTALYLVDENSNSKLVIDRSEGVAL